jgi:hypothetical protein
MYDEMLSQRSSTHVNTNFNILKLIYDYRVIEDVVNNDADIRVRKWCYGISEHMKKIGGIWQYHRIGHPAIECQDENFLSFYIEGYLFIDANEYCNACHLDEIDTMVFILKYGQSLPYF